MVNQEKFKIGDPISLKRTGKSENRPLNSSQNWTIIEIVDKPPTEAEQVELVNKLHLKFELDKHRRLFDGLNLLDNPGCVGLVDPTKIYIAEE